MKRLILPILVVIVLLIVASSYCVSKNNKIVEENVEVVSKDENSKDEYAITSLNNLILKDCEMTPENMYSSIQLERVNDDGTAYIAVIKHGDFWTEEVWYINYDGEKITDKRHIKEVDGNILSYKNVELSQGTYIEFYTATNMGNGQTVLWNPILKKVEYVFERNTIDAYKESYVNEMVVKKYDLPKMYEEPGYGYSFVYQGDILTSHYKDLNNDGYDDATFTGVKKLVADFEVSPIKLFYVEEVYLYDEEKNTFVYSKKLSKEEELKE